MFDVIGDTVRAFTELRTQPWNALGNTLLVGEGNLSFGSSLLDIPTTHITSMTATTFEKQNQITEDTIKNAGFLQKQGALVLYGVDATKLEKTFKSHQFDTIIFQFPNVGSREAKYGHNPNHILIRKFLRSAPAYLAPNGKVMITAVDSPHYEGAFQFDEAAEFAGYEAPTSYPFDPAMFSGYSHINTNDDDSALDDHNKFATWVFKLKR